MRISLRYSEKMPDIYVSWVPDTKVIELMRLGYKAEVRVTPGIPKSLKGDINMRTTGKWHPQFWDSQNNRRHKIFLTPPHSYVPIIFCSMRMNAEEVRMLKLEPIAKAEATEKKLEMLCRISGNNERRHW